MSDILLTSSNTKYFENILNKKKCKLCILIFGCAVVPEYKEQIDNILETWGKDCDKNDVPFFVFIGKNIDEYKKNEHIISLENQNVKDDYNSAAFKQYIGMQWILSRYDTEFLFIAGSDTYPNSTGLLNLLENFNCDNSEYIGDGVFTCQVFNHKIQMHSGAAGFILSRAALNIIEPYLYQFNDRWQHLITSWYGPDSLYMPACDVSIALFAFIKGVTFVRRDGFHDLQWHACPNINNIVSCHHMKKKECLDYYEYLNKR